MRSISVNAMPVGVLLPALLLGLPFVWLPTSMDPASAPRLVALQLVNVVGMVVFVQQQGWRWFPRRVWWALLACIVFWLLPALWAVNREAALFGWLRCLALFQLMLWGGYLCCRHHKLSLLPAVATLLGGLLALVGTLQVFHVDLLPFEQHYPPAISFLNKNVAGELIAGLMPLALCYLLLVRRGRRLIGAWVACGLMVFFWVMAESRTAWVASFVCFWVVAGNLLLIGNHREMLARCPWQRGLLRLFLVLLLGAALLWAHSLARFPVQTAISDELKTFVRFGAYENRNLNTVQVRLSMYLNGLRMLEDHLVAGVGLDNLAVHYPRYHEAVRPTPSYSLLLSPEVLHNDVLQLGVETGLPGLAAFLYLVWLVFTARRTDDGPGALAVHTVLRAMVLVLLIESCFSFSLHRTTPGAWLWLGMGVLLAREPREPSAFRPGGWWQPAVPAMLMALLLVPPVTMGISLKNAIRAAEAWDLEGAHHALMKAHQWFPADPRSIDRALTLALNSENNQRALELLAVFQQRNPHHPNGYWRKALILYNLDQPEQAMAALQQAYRFCQPTIMMRYLEAKLLVQTGKADEGQALLEEIEQKDRVLYGMISRWY